MKRLVLVLAVFLGVVGVNAQSAPRQNQYGQRIYVVTVITKTSGTVKVEISARDAYQAKELAKKQYLGATIGAALPKK